jgi:hypothetical protein
MAPGYRQQYAFVSFILFDYRQHFTKDSRYITSIYFIDYQIEIVCWILLCIEAHPFHYPVLELENHLIIDGFWTITFEKVLVSVRRVKGTYPD